MALEFYLWFDTLTNRIFVAPPSPPQKLRVTDVTSRSVTIQWEPPANTGGSELIGYVVEKRLSTQSSSAKWTRVVTLDTYCQQYCIDNLKEKSEYIFRVLDENAVGLSAPAVTENIVLKTHASKWNVPTNEAREYFGKSLEQNFSHISAVPSPPTAPLEVRGIGYNTSIFEWGIPEFDGGAPLEGYNIAIRDLKRTMWIEVGRVGPDVQKFQIRDLQEDHEYLIRIFARNEVGLSEPLESDEPYKVLPSQGESICKSASPFFSSPFSISIAHRSRLWRGTSN